MPEEQLKFDFMCDGVPVNKPAAEDIPTDTPEEVPSEIMCVCDCLPCRDGMCQDCELEIYNLGFKNNELCNEKYKGDGNA